MRHPVPDQEYLREHARELPRLKQVLVPIRLQILDLLMTGAQNPDAVSKQFNIRPSVACTHLNVLLRNGWLEKIRDGQKVFYRIRVEDRPDVGDFLAEIHKLYSCAKGIVNT